MKEKNMKTLFVERFTLQKFLDNFLTDKHIKMFKESLEIYKKTKGIYYNNSTVEKLQFLIDGKNNKRVDCHLDYRAIEFFGLIYDMNALINYFNRLNKEPDEWMKQSEQCYKYLTELCNTEDSKLYWQKKNISQDYINEDIIITDSCYLYHGIDEDDKRRKENPPCDLYADTIYGDWGCTVYNKDTKEKLGRFCADSGNVCVAKLKDVLKFNPNFEKWMKEHDWCVTLIKNFNGAVSIIYDIEHYEYKGKQHKDLYCYVEGKGNINFIARQTDI